MLTWIWIQDRSDEVASRSRYRLIRWEIVTILLDAFVYRFDVFRLEGGFANQHGVAVLLSAVTRCMLLTLGAHMMTPTDQISTSKLCPFA